MKEYGPAERVLKPQSAVVSGYEVTVSKGRRSPELDTHDRQSHETPQGGVEEILAGIWRELFSVEHIGRDDNFFELGGNSLLVSQMMDRLHRAGLSLDVGQIFLQTSLADLAMTCQACRESHALPNMIPARGEQITPQMLPLVELEPEHIEKIVRAVPNGVANIQDIYPLTPMQEGLLFQFLLNNEGMDPYVRPVLIAVCSRQKLDALIGAFQMLIDRHDILRSAVLWEQLPRPVQVVYRRASLPVVELVLDRHRDAVEQLKKRMEFMRQDLRRAPMMRLEVAADPNGPGWYGLWQLHHMTCDHQALEVISTEIIAYLEGRSQTLPDSVPYRNHVAYMQSHAHGADAEAFFRNRLGDVEKPTAPFGVLDLCGDSSQIEEASEELSPELAQHVRMQARRLGVSEATLFHAAWALVVSRTSGRDDVVFGSVLLGRLRSSAGAERAVGMFVNTLPLRLHLRATTAEDLLWQTNRELAELLNHEHASLAQARRCARLVGRAPLFTAVLNYRRSSVDRESELARIGAMRVVAGVDRTNYPVVLLVDDVSEKFRLCAQTDRRIDPHLIIRYLHAALRSLVDALEHAPKTLAQSLSILLED